MLRQIVSKIVRSSFCSSLTWPNLNELLNPVVTLALRISGENESTLSIIPIRLSILPSLRFFTLIVVSSKLLLCNTFIFKFVPELSSLVLIPDGHSMTFQNSGLLIR